MSIGALGHILCLEGNWDDDLTSRTSVLPMLELLHRLDKIAFVHRDIGTRPELEHYLERWAGADESVAGYGLLYLAFHGVEEDDDETALWISGADDGTVSFSHLADCLHGALEEAVIYLGSCSMLALDDAIVQRFFDATGARAVIGYGAEIDWVPSAAMDMLVFDAIAGCDRWKDAARELTRSTAIRALRTDPGLDLRVYSA